MKYSLITIIFLVILSSCSFNSTFFAIKKQNLNSKITYLNSEDIYVQSEDSKKIYCLLLKPEKQALGTIFFLQGSGDNIASWSSYTEHFVKGGYQVFMMEYRGFGKNNDKPTHRNVLKDAERALDYIIKSGKVNGNKVIALGQSYGGQIAINLTSNHPDKICALITEGTFTSFNDEATFSVPDIIKPFVKLMVYSPYKSKKLIKKISGIPVLIIHSQNDKVVPFKMSEKLYKNANSPKYIWKIQGDHIRGIEKYPKEYLEKIRILIKMV